MADITDPQAIKFVNEQVRVLAEKTRQLKVEIDAIEADWFNGINTLISGQENVIDGREAEGVSRLTGSDVVNLMTQLLAIQSILDGSGVEGVIAKPCVRPLRANG